jgi:hypothetical protein
MAKELTRTELAALRASLPPMPSINEEQWTLAMYKTYKNTSIRPTPEMAAKLVYLKLIHHRPKANVVKECIEDGLVNLWNRTIRDARKMRHIKT